MVFKGTKLYSVFKGYCPRCHAESMYKFKLSFWLFDVLKMNTSCSNCNLKYQIEPSFFFGAMYISYAIGIIISVLLGLLYYAFFGFNTLKLFLCITVGLIILSPIIMRLSRNIWINFFVDFDASKATT